MEIVGVLKNAGNTWGRFLVLKPIPETVPFAKLTERGEASLDGAVVRGIARILETLRRRNECVLIKQQAGILYSLEPSAFHGFQLTSVRSLPDTTTPIPPLVRSVLVVWLLQLRREPQRSVRTDGGAPEKPRRDAEHSGARVFPEHQCHQDHARRAARPGKGRQGLLRSRQGAQSCEVHGADRRRN